MKVSVKAFALACAIVGSVVTLVTGIPIRLGVQPVRRGAGWDYLTANGFRCLA